MRAHHTARSGRAGIPKQLLKSELPAQAPMFPEVGSANSTVAERPTALVGGGPVSSNASD